MEWFVNHVESIVVVLTGIVALTPTTADDGVLGRVVNLLRAFANAFKKGS